MLDSTKLIEQLERSLPQLFKQTELDSTKARDLFFWLLDNPTIIKTLQETNTPHPMPQWDGLLTEQFHVISHSYPYQVVAADGSQIYPDKHQGIDCFLINCGIAHFTYGISSSNAQFLTEPRIYTVLDSSLAEELVDCRRSEQEFELGLRASLAAQSSSIPLLFLSDGTLIFWHVTNKSPQLKELFLKRYIELLDGYYQQGIMIAGYISLPRAKDIVGILKNCITLRLYQPVMSFDTIVDADIMSLFLSPHHRTTIFKHNSALADVYPEHLKPYFVYLNNGFEIVRIEIPAWIALDEEKLSTTVRIIADQIIKGNGYPIALSEAHEQAVIKQADRSFFFELIYNMGKQHNHRFFASQKSLKKRYTAL